MQIRSFAIAAIACAAAAASAAPVSAAPSSPAAEIAAAAVACVEALGRRGPDTAALESAGWRAEASSRGSFARAGSNVRIDLVPMGAGMCVVNAYGESADSFDAIAAAINAGLTARFGRDVSLARAVGDESSFSRGQGYRIGNRLSVLSSERRPDGLSIRVTAMAMPR